MRRTDTKVGWTVLKSIFFKQISLYQTFHYHMAADKSREQPCIRGCQSEYMKGIQQQSGQGEGLMQHV
jgi:hypothetical protein